MRSHEWIERRSLALDRLIAQKLAERPELLQHAVRTLERWIAQRQPQPPAAPLEWRQILRERSLPEILELLLSNSDECAHEGTQPETPSTPLRNVPARLNTCNTSSIPL
jgi:hypothetical protein